MKKTTNNLYIKASFVAFLMSLSSLVFAQDYIDEDFLGSLETNAHFMLTEPAYNFKESMIPSKWNNESAVIIGYARSIMFDRESRGGFLTRRERSLWFLEKDHLKIRLNDNNAVQSFSEIYFRYGTKQDGFIAHIIKPDGSSRIIDLKTAIAVEDNNNVPEFFQSFFDKVANSQYKYYKVPVADLEPGDILEYVTNTRSKLDVTNSGLVVFTPVYEVCSKKYPVMYNEIIIETDDKSFFKSQSQNGAPEFVKESTSDGFFKYVFTDRNRDTEKDVNFVSPYLTYPLVKFQVVYSNSAEARGALIGVKGELKNTFTKEELAKKAWEEFDLAGNEQYNEMAKVQDFVNACQRELHVMGAREWPQKQYPDKLYYYLRNKIVFRNTYMPDKEFAYIFYKLLDAYDLKPELIISVPNNITRLKDVLFDDEIKYVTKLDDKLYYNPTDYSNPGEIDDKLAGNEAYIIAKPERKGGHQDIKPFTFPGTTASDNVTEISIKAQLTADMKNLMVIRNTGYKGIPKAKSTVSALKYIPYMFDDYKNYGGEPPTNKMKNKELEDYNSSVQAIKDEWKKRKPEYVKESLESEFDYPVQNIHFELISDGRSQKKSALIVKEGFELESFVRKAGKKYLLNLPGLMNAQLQIKKEERKRTYDIDVRYPETFLYNIEFQIPEGYTAQGLTELNKNIENDAASFSLKAREENGQVILNIAKVYKQRSIPRGKWDDLLNVIDTAYNSYFQYVLLVPKK